MIKMEKVEIIRLFPFKFNANWGLSEEVRKLVDRAWKTNVQGSLNYVWESKLKNVKKELRNWLKENYQPPSKKRQDKVQELDEHYKLMEEVPIEEKHIQEENDLSTHIYSLSIQEEKLWRLKSCSLWLKSRDSNTSFFHK